MTENNKEKRGGGLIRVAVERPVTVVVTAVLVIVFGALSVVGLPIQLTPDVSRPTLNVRTRWVGASPTEIEAEILERQETELKDVPGLLRMTGSASLGDCSLTLEFGNDVNIDDALVRVSNRLGQIGDYPEGADRPRVDTASGTGPPIVVAAIRSRRGESVAAYRTWVAETAVPELQRIDGVGWIFHIGGRDTVLTIDFDPRELAARGIRIASLAERIQGEVLNISAGDIEYGRRRLLVRVMGVRPEPEELAEIVVASAEDGSPIHLGDVATVSLGLRDPGGVAFSDDRPSMVLLIGREAGSNVLEVTEAIRERVDELDRERFAPEGLEFEVLSDQSEYIRGSLSLVQQNLIVGALLAVIALFFFLRSFGASAIVSMAIPICVFGTALGMSLFGRSVNVVSLAGITFAVGMVLDNSIVSLESIDTWRHRTDDPRDAAYRGVREVWGALLASTATTAAVFLPVITWQGEVGQLLKDIAVAISFAVITSLLVSVWVIPGLASRVLKTKRPSAPKRDIATQLRRSVGNAVAWVSQRVYRSLAVVSVAVTGCVLLVVLLLPPLEYLPTGNRNLVFGILVPPVGTSVGELEEVGARMQASIAPHIGRELDGAPAIERAFFVGSPERVFAGGVAADPDEVDELLAWLREVQSEIPGFISFATQASIFGQLGGSRSVEIDLSGSDLTHLTALGRQLFGRLREALPGAQVRPIPTLNPGAPELRLYPRRRELARLNLTSRELGRIVDSMLDGALVGQLVPEGEPRLDVIARARRRSGQRLENADDLRSAPVTLPDGAVVPLGTLVDIREELGPTVIQHVERRRVVRLLVSPPEDMPLETAIEVIRRDVVAAAQQSDDYPSGVRIDYAGAAGDLEIAKSQFAFVLIIALLISYLLMSAVFEDFLAPVVVLVSVPLAAAGGVLGLRFVDEFVADQSLDLMTALGFLILIGVVVNNAILVVDRAIASLQEGAALDEAVRTAVESRIRPILMTTATSLAGLLPMVMIPGSGSELYRGVGSIVLGGLALSTALTIFVVPALFALLWRIRRFLSRKKPSEEAPSPDATETT